MKRNSLFQKHPIVTNQGLGFLVIYIFLLAPFSFGQVDDQKDKSKIILYGEIHTNPQDIMNGDLLLHAAKQGYFYIGIESLIYQENRHRDKTQTVFGYEDALPLALASVGVNFNDLFIATGYKIISRFSQESEDYSSLAQEKFLFKFFPKNPLILKAWDRLHRPFNGREEEVALLIDSIINSNSSDEVEQRILFSLDKSADSSSIWHQDQYFLSVSKKLAVSLGQLIENEYEIEPEYLALYSAFIENPTQNIEEFFDIIVLELRNESMAKNIAKIYRSISGEGKPLIVITGENHVPGLAELLDEEFKGLVEILKIDKYNIDQVVDADISNQTGK